MLAIRFRIILKLLQAAGSPMSATRLMKLSFILSQECLDSTVKFYHFVPYRYGPYSFALAHDLAKLEQKGIVNRSSNGWEIATRDPALVEQMPTSLERKIETLLSTTLANASAHSLTQYVYARYPWYTVNSRITAHREERPQAKRAVYTIGYESQSIDQFINTILQTGIATVIDVRSNPVSRKYGFSRAALSSLLSKLDIGYVHLPDLGIPGAVRRPLIDGEDYRALFRIYERDIIPTAMPAVREASRLTRLAPSVLMCFESDPTYCHRSSLAAILAPETGLPVVHLRG